MIRAMILLILAFGAWVAHAAPMNVVVLLADDQRADTIGALGNPHIDTPNLDRLVARGTAFSNAYIMGSRNGAVCMPSRAMLMTGRPLFAFDEMASPIPAEYPLLPEQFRKAGYDTFITGKWHQDYASMNRAFVGGARIFMAGMHDPFSVPLRPYDPTGAYPKEAIEVREGEHASALLADTAVTYLQGRSAAQPFFLYVAFTAPHDPRVAPKEYHERYAKKPPPLPENFLPEHPFDNGEQKIRDELLAGFPRTEAEVRQHLADYYASITHLDSQIGRVLDALAASGAADNTLVVYSADNGLAIGSHGLMGKQSVYEHSVRVPLVIAGPGVPEGRKTEALVYLNDLYPTLLDWCGVEAERPPFAKSFAPVLRGAADSHRTFVTFAYKGEQRGIRQGDCKLLLCNARGARHVRLFNLSKDPAELHDLSGDAAHSVERERLVALLLAECKAQGDGFVW